MMKKHSDSVVMLKRSMRVLSLLGFLLSSGVRAYQVPVGIASNELMSDGRYAVPFGYQQTYAQNRTNKPKREIRSKSEVVREIKQRYNANVLKISLNSKGTAYNVRVLMPNGRVRQITVSALR